MNLTSNQKKIVSNVAWALSGKFINMFGNLFVGILVARYLGPEDYGIMNYVISYVTIFTIVSAFGLDNIEIRELSKDESGRDRIMGTSFMLRLLFSIIAYVVLTIIVFCSVDDGFTVTMILVYGLSLFSTIYNLFRNYFTSIVYNKYVVQSEITRTIIGAVIKIVFLLLKFPLSWFIFATLFDTILLATGYYFSYRSKAGSVRKWSFDRDYSKFLVKESFPLVLSGTAVIIYQKIDQVMIGDMIDKESVGYFATAGRFVEVVLFLPSILVQTITPLLIKKRELDSQIYKKDKQIFVNLVTWLTIGIAIITSITSYWTIKYTFGEAYMPAVPILQIMAFKTVGMALSSSGGQIIILEGIQRWAFIRNIIGCLICVSLNYIIIPQFGVIGSAYVTVVTVLFTGCLANLFIPPYHSIMKIQLIALFCGWKDIIRLKQLNFRK